MTQHPDDWAQHLAAIAALPKVELHLHLEGAAPPAFIRSLAKVRGINIEAAFAPDGGYAYADFNGFLRTYERATSVLKGPADYAALLGEVLAHSASQNVRYTELFLCPDFCGGGDLAAWQDHVAALAEAAQQARNEHGIEMRGIVTIVRHFGAGQARQTARVAAETAGDFITGFGIGGAEDFGRLQDYAWAFDCAREAGLGLTAHAGEWGGPSSIRDALSLKVSRIGHGVHAIQDPALMDDLIEQQILLEVCPGSNVALGVVDSLADHPIERLRAAGLAVSVSTDDPPFFHTTMRQEYRGLAETFGWDAARFAAINRASMGWAFCDAQTRAKIEEVFAP